jgi:hypothetical protein
MRFVKEKVKNNFFASTLQILVLCFHPLLAFLTFPSNDDFAGYALGPLLTEN